MHSSGVKHTCPDIDRIKKTLFQMVKDMEYYVKIECDSDTISDFLSSSASELYSMTDELEDLRVANSDLRLWGEGLLEEKEALELQISALEDLNDK